MRTDPDSPRASFSSEGADRSGSLSKSPRDSPRTCMTVKTNPQATLILQRARREDRIAHSDVGLEVRELDEGLVAGLHVLAGELHRLKSVVLSIDALHVLGAGSLQQLAILVVDLPA